MAAPPLAHHVALLVGGVLEPNAGLIPISLPRHFSIDFELMVHAGQFESEAERGFLRYAVRKLKSHSTFAEVDGLGFVAARPVTFDRNLHSDPQLQPPFTLHQGANRTKTRFSALNRKGFVEDEMSPDFETTLESDGSLHQHYPEGPTIDGRGLGSPQYIAGFLNILPVHDDRFETLAGDPADGIVHPRTMLDANFQITENPAQNAHRLFVGTQ